MKDAMKEESSTPAVHQSGGRGEENAPRDPGEKDKMEPKEGTIRKVDEENTSPVKPEETR